MTENTGAETQPGDIRFGVGLIESPPPLWLPVGSVRAIGFLAGTLIGGVILLAHTFGAGDPADEVLVLAGGLTLGSPAAYAAIRQRPGNG
jgi:hypothetical protein